MKVHIIVCLFGMLASTLGRPDSYSTKYDGIDIDELIGNKRLLKGYILCALDEGPCSPEGLEFKSHIAEALETRCEKCSERQLEIVKKAFKHLINEENEYWNKLCDKYDPTKKYVNLYEKELQEVLQ